MNAQIDITGVKLTTDRLILRPFRATDLQDLNAYASMDGLGQMAGWLPHKSLAESREILGMFMAEKKVLALEFQGKVIGSAGIERYSEEKYPEYAALQGREIGYAMSKDYWGRGLMPEAVQAVIKYLFEEIGLDFIMVGHFEWNNQSRRVIEKCSFRYVRTTLRETRYETVENSMDYILERSDYRADT